MRYWSYAINSYYKTATIYLEEASMFILFLERMVEFLCDIFSVVGLPHIPWVLFDKTSIEFNSGERKIYLDEWHGTLGSVFCMLIHSPVISFCDKYKKRIGYEADYNEVKKLFYNENKKFFDEHEEICWSIKVGEI